MTLFYRVLVLAGGVLMLHGYDALGLAVFGGALYACGRHNQLKRAAFRACDITPSLVEVEMLRRDPVSLTGRRLVYRARGLLQALEGGSDPTGAAKRMNAALTVIENAAAQEKASQL